MRTNISHIEKERVLHLYQKYDFKFILSMILAGEGIVSEEKDKERLANVDHRRTISLRRATGLYSTFWFISCSSIALRFA